MGTTLDKPVKTYLMNAVGSCLQGVTVINSTQIKYGEGLATDQDTAAYPWTCFFDQAEPPPQKRNRIAIKEFDLVIQVWVKKSTSSIDDQMDLISAEIEKAILNDANVKLYSLLVLPNGSDKLTVDDDETRILQAIYRVQYAHAWKDPYLLQKE